jgi:hypothetical protein
MSFWYNQTKNLPDPIVAMATVELGPKALRHYPEDQGYVLWNEQKDCEDKFKVGYLFASQIYLSQEAVITKGLHITLPDGRKAFYVIDGKSYGYIGEGGGDRLYAYVINRVSLKVPA